MEKVMALRILLQYHHGELLRMHAKNVEYLATVYTSAMIDYHEKEMHRALEELEELAYAR